MPSNLFKMTCQRSFLPTFLTDQLAAKLKPAECFSFCSDSTETNLCRTGISARGSSKINIGPQICYPCYPLYHNTLKRWVLRYMVLATTFFDSACGHPCILPSKNTPMRLYTPIKSTFRFPHGLTWHSTLLNQSDKAFLPASTIWEKAIFTAYCAWHCSFYDFSLNHLL